jgi:hypothetical protein
MVVAECDGGSGVGNVEVELKSPSLSSRNTLGDTNHNSNNLKCNGDQNGLGCGSRWWYCGSYGGRPRQTCQILKILMESNGVGTYLDGWGMSIAIQRAKERQNRTPDVKVMAQKVKHCWLKFPGVGHPGVRPEIRDCMSRNVRDFALQEPDVRPGTRMSGPMVRMSGLWPGCPAR